MTHIEVMSLVEAAKQALEALQNTVRVFEDPSDLLVADVELVLEATNALRSAIEQAEKQAALDRMADNARELGLDYTPPGAEKQEPYAWEFAGTIFYDKDEVFGWWNSDHELSDTPPLALYTAPPQQEKQEPVAWGMRNAWGEVMDCITPTEHAREEGGYTVPLYTAPPQRQPLTLPELAKVMASVPSLPFEGDWHLEFARAIERAHGIGGGHD